MTTANLPTTFVSDPNAITAAAVEARLQQAGIQLTMGGVAPAAPAAFVRDVLFTAPGQTMIVVGMGVGFVFALLAMNGSRLFSIFVDGQ